MSDIAIFKADLIRLFRNYKASDRIEHCYQDIIKLAVCCFGELIFDAFNNIDVRAIVKPSTVVNVKDDNLVLYAIMPINPKDNELLVALNQFSTGFNEIGTLNDDGGHLVLPFMVYATNGQLPSQIVPSYVNVFYPRLHSGVKLLVTHTKLFQYYFDNGLFHIQFNDNRADYNDKFLTVAHDISVHFLYLEKIFLMTYPAIQQQLKQFDEQLLSSYSKGSGVVIDIK